MFNRTKKCRFETTWGWINCEKGSKVLLYLHIFTLHFKCMTHFYLPRGTVFWVSKMFLTARHDKLKERKTFRLDLFHLSDRRSLMSIYFLFSNNDSWIFWPSQTLVSLLSLCVCACVSVWFLLQMYTYNHMPVHTPYAHHNIENKTSGCVDFPYLPSRKNKQLFLRFVSVFTVPL